MLDFFLENLDYTLIIIFDVAFVYMTKICFMEKWSIPKTLLLILISPPPIIYGAAALNIFLSMLIWNHAGMVSFSVIKVIFISVQILIELVFCAGFSLLYIVILRPKNRTLGIFVYLIHYYLCDLFFSMILQYSDADWSELIIVFFFINLILLYTIVIRPLSTLTDVHRQVNRSVFILLPSAVFLFSVITYGIVYSNFTISLKEEHPDFITIFPLFFISILLILAYSVIVRNVKYISEVSVARDDLKTLSVEVMEALARTIDAKDKYTNGHSMRVAKYSRMMAEKMGLSQEMCDNIYYMGLLHDIGKIGVPNEIINKTSRLTDDEYSIIKTHPNIGYGILSEIKSRPDLSKGALWHHERFDGKGYPDHKAGTDIPLESRIIAIADTYDAMTSNRSYRNYLPQDVVRGEIEKNAGTQFDPDLVKYMLMIIDEDTLYLLHE